MQQLQMGFVGAGQIATVLAKGFVNSGTISAENIRAYSPSAASRAKFEVATGGQAAASNDEVIKESSIVFLSVKPQIAPTILPLLNSTHGRDKLFVSVMAGFSLARLGTALGTDRIVRVMPSTPCLVGKGTAAISAHTGATEEDLQQIEALMGTVAVTYRLPETALDAVTGMANPAYVFEFIKALADGGVLAGLPRPIAMDLAANTVLGAAAMVLETSEHPAVLTDRVASPAGTTIAGLYQLEKGGLGATLMSAVEAATSRSRELGKS